MKTGVRDLLIYIAFCAVAVIAIRAIDEWEARPPGLFGAVAGLSLGVAYLLGQRAGRRS